MDILVIFRIIFCSLYVLVIPGLVLTFVFFQKKEVDWLERIILSVALSIAVVPLTVFLSNLIGIKINTFNVVIEILWIIIFSLIWILFRKSGYYHKIADKIIKIKK